jgi:hypothetical protein
VELLHRRRRCGLCAHKETACLRLVSDGKVTTAEVDPIGRTTGEGGGCCKRRPNLESLVQLATIGIALKIDVLVLEAAPQPLDEDVVHLAPAAVHRDASPAVRFGNEAEKSDQLLRRGKATYIANFTNKGDRNEERHTPQGLGVPPLRHALAQLPLRQRRRARGTGITRYYVTARIGVSSNPSFVITER